MATFQNHIIKEHSVTFIAISLLLAPITSHSKLQRAGFPDFVDLFLRVTKGDMSMNSTE